MPTDIIKPAEQSKNCNIYFAQVYLTLMIDGIGSQPFSAVTLPPVERPHSSCKDMVIAASRKNYTKNRDEVEQVVIDLHTPKKPEPKANNKPAGGAQDPRDRLRAIACGAHDFHVWDRLQRKLDAAQRQGLVVS